MSAIVATIFFARLFFIIFVCALMFNPYSAEAETILSFPGGWITNGYVMTQEGSPYIINTSTLRMGSSATVTAEAGTVIKFRTGLDFPGQFIIYGRFIINGTEENPVVITSYKDDEYGGDTNGDESASSPSPGDWDKISISGGILDADYLIMRYGGKYNYSELLLSGDSASVSLRNSVIEHSAWDGIRTFSSGNTLSVVDSVVRYNASSGIRLQNNTIADISGTVFTGNKYGFLGVGGLMDSENITISNNSFFDNDDAGFFYAGDDLAILDARDNWWGSSAGPTHDNNPGGDGDVIESNYVLFDPWTGKAPENQPPSLSYSREEGYSSDGVNPDISFITSDMPVFRVLYEDSDEDAAQYARLVVGEETYDMATTSTSTIYAFTPDAGVFPKGSYSYHFEASDGTDTVRLPSEGELLFEVKHVPVILVPGIMGTELWREDDKILWLDIAQMMFWWLDDFLNPLAMNTDGTPSDDRVVVGDVVRSPKIALLPVYDYFSGIIAEFQVNNYQEGTDLFVFPYDWRLDIRDSSQKLEEKIDAVTAQTGSQKVDIVVHSMGGLVTKQYVLDNSASKINKLVFVGTPHLGSPKSTKMLLFGDDLVKLFLSFLNPQKMKHLSRNMLSIYQLLPSQKYIDQIGKYFYNLTIPKSFTHAEVNNYLTAQGLNSPHLQGAMNFHSDAMDNFDTTNIETYNIVGCDTATLGKIIIRNQELIETEYGIEFMAGDGTVPLGSATAISTESEKTFYAKGIEHATMPSQESIKQLITQIISEDIDISGLSDITQDINQCVFNGQVVSVHSPVNLHVYDNNGNHIGPDENGDIEMDIAGATYEQIGDNKFVFIPDTDDVSYNIQLDGTNSGTFSLRVSKIEDSEIKETAYYADIPVNDSSEATITLSDNVSSTILEVDESGTGNFETVSVASVLNSVQSSDITKPTTAISVSGGTNSAQFTLSAIDNNSGIFKTEYSLNNGQTWNNYTSSVIINTIGNNQVLFRSKDRAGNLEDYKSETIKVSSAAVILIPTPNHNHTTEPDSWSDSISKSVPNPEVLGVKTERAKNEQYSDNDILSALTNADTNILLDYLGQVRNLSLEKNIPTRYSKKLIFTQAEINFIGYGTKSTLSLGSGERAGVIHSFYEAFNRLPKTNDDWNDIIRIATNQAPIQRSAEAEKRAKDAGAKTEQDILMSAYGVRPKKRDLKKEEKGIAEFAQRYEKLPSSTFDWNILRSIVY